VERPRDSGGGGLDLFLLVDGVRAGFEFLPRPRWEPLRIDGRIDLQVFSNVSWTSLSDNCQLGLVPAGAVNVRRFRQDDCAMQAKMRRWQKKSQVAQRGLMYCDTMRAQGRRSAV
jgi:hypothetical protein